MSESESGDFRRLLESLPQEISADNNPLPEHCPLTRDQKDEALEWLSSRNGGGVTVTLFAPFHSREIRDEILESMLLNGWFIPNKIIANQIPLQAFSGHKTGSSTIPLRINGETKSLNVVIKPFHSKYSKAELELRKFQEVQRRHISTVNPLGLIDIDDPKGHDTFSMTVLKKGIVPLQKINFEQLYQNEPERFQQLKDLLRNLGIFIAQMHNSGVTHGNLHLGNIGLDLTQETAQEFVLFDLEKATIIPQDKLGVKNRTRHTLEVGTQRKFVKFEKGAVNDIANIAADIAARNPAVSYDTILHNLVIPYFSARKQSHGLPSEVEFIDSFDQRFKTRQSQISRFIRTSQEELLQLGKS